MMLGGKVVCKQLTVSIMAPLFAQGVCLIGQNASEPLWLPD